MSDLILLDELKKLSQAVRKNKMMLIALHRNNPFNNFQWIDAYAIGATEGDGLDGKRSVFVLLSGVGDNMATPTVKVYPSENKELPLFISTAVKWDMPDDYQTLTGKGADKANLRKKNLLIECPKFAIIRYDGKMTEIGPQKKLACIIEMSYAAHQAEMEAQAKVKATPKPKAPVAEAVRVQLSVPAVSPVAVVEVAKADRTDNDNPFTPRQCSNR